VSGGGRQRTRLEAVRLEFGVQVRRFEEAKTPLQAIAGQIGRDRQRQEILRHSAFARLQAKLESMPVIEQAKGILMAQQRCGPDEAFDLLRRASQRAYVKVSVLAAQIAGQVALPTTASRAVPAQPATSRHLERLRSPGPSLDRGNGQPSAQGRGG
jgi:ANTAR domain